MYSIISPKRQQQEITNTAKPRGEIINIDIEGTYKQIDLGNSMRIEFSILLEQNGGIKFFTPTFYHHPRNMTLVLRNLDREMHSSSDFKSKMTNDSRFFYLFNEFTKHDASCTDKPKTTDYRQLYSLIWNLFEATRHCLQPLIEISIICGRPLRSTVRVLE